MDRTPRVYQPEDPHRTSLAFLQIKSYPLESSLSSIVFFILFQSVADTHHVLLVSARFPAF